MSGCKFRGDLFPPDQTLSLRPIRIAHMNLMGMRLAVRLPRRFSVSAHNMNRVQLESTAVTKVRSTGGLKATALIQKGTTHFLHCEDFFLYRLIEVGKVA